MFDEAWGVDVAVSTPRLMTALVEEAVSVGDLVRIFEFQQGKAMMVEMTLPLGSPYAGSRVGDVPFPGDTVLTGIIREGPRSRRRATTPSSRSTSCSSSPPPTSRPSWSRCSAPVSATSATPTTPTTTRTAEGWGRRALGGVVSMDGAVRLPHAGRSHGRQVTAIAHDQEAGKSIKEKRAEKHAKADAKNHLDLGKK